MVLRHAAITAEAEDRTITAIARNLNQAGNLAAELFH
jgi:hypothetical protein